MRWIYKLVSKVWELALLTAACMAAGDWASAADEPYLLQPGDGRISASECEAATASRFAAFCEQRFG